MIHVQKLIFANNEISGIYDDIELLESIFDVTKIYKQPIPVELDGTLVCPRITEMVEQPLEKDCPDCDGSGEVTISDYVGKHYYEAECE